MSSLIVALGDSLTAGYGLRSQEAYPALLQQRIATARLPYRVVNAGVSGETTAAARRRVSTALAGDVSVLMVALGANDGLGGVPVAEVEANLAFIIEEGRRRGARVLLCGFEALPLYGWDYTIRFHRLYESLGRQYDLPLVPFVLAQIIGRRELLLGDLVHPNAAGARIIADVIWPYLHAMLAAPVA
jgi:acyl-CoA thioesterase I